jgi:ethanolamine utilization microcompartment shell protein EutS
LRFDSSCDEGKYENTSALIHFVFLVRYCGSCYIHGALHAANDRLKIMLNGMHDVQLARQGRFAKS